MGYGRGAEFDPYGEHIKILLSIIYISPHELYRVEIPLED